MVDYKKLFDTCKIREEKKQTVKLLTDRIFQNRERYEVVSKKTGVPWYFIGVTHLRESSLSFDKHLHNGDPLTNRTKRVPKGYPKTGNPPFTWEESAISALGERMHLDKVRDWSLAGVLYQLERYNGFGYRNRGHLSPYLWSFTNHYTKGKFVKDGKYDPNTVDRQCGTAAILKELQNRGLLSSQPILRYSLRYSNISKTLQEFLNSIGCSLTVDGYAGPNTSNAFKEVSGYYLYGDPKGENNDS